MKKLIPSLLVATVLGVGAVATVSACPGDGKQGKRLDRAVERLELTADQEAQFREVMLDMREDMKEYFQAQRDETIAELSTFLTEDQLAEFEEMSERRFGGKKNGI